MTASSSTDDRVRKVALGVATARPAPLPRARSKGPATGASARVRSNPVPEVLRAHGFAGRVHDPLAERESIAQAVGGDLGQRRRQVRDERGPIRTARPSCRSRGCRRLSPGPCQTIRVVPRRPGRARAAPRSPRTWSGFRLGVRWPRHRRPARAPPRRSRARRPLRRTVRSLALVRRPGRSRRPRRRTRAPTHSEPPAAASAFGPCPTGMVASSRPVEGSSRDTVRSSWFATQIDPNAGDDRGRPVPHLLCEHDVRTGWVDARDAVRRDRDPHGFRRERDARGQAGERRARRSPRCRIHAEQRTTDRVDDPQHTVADRDPRRCGAARGLVRLTSLVSTLIRLTVPSPALVTQPAPSPIATPEGEVPTRIEIGDRTRLEFQARHDASVRLRDPEAPEPDRTGAWPLAQLGRELHAAILSVQARDRVRSDLHFRVSSRRQQRDRDRDEREDRRGPRRSAPRAGASPGAGARAARTAATAPPNRALGGRRGRPCPAPRSP